MNKVSSNVPLVINQLSKNIYNELSAQGQLQSNQLYIVEEDNLDASSGTIINVAAPVADTDAANKKYVDDISSNVVNNIKTDITNTLTGYVENSELTEYATKTHLTNALTGYVKNTSIDSSLIENSVNPVQNAVVTKAINDLSEHITNELGNISTLLDTI